MVRTPFHLLAKPTGAICNLDCSYCFFLSKESLYPGSSFRMSDETLKRYLHQLIDAQPGREVQIAFQGGEPTLMGVEFFERAVDIVTEYIGPGRTASYTIQTNAVLIDDSWASFFAEQGFLVGVSIDGPEAIHDRYRVNKGVRGVSIRCSRAIERFRSTRSTSTFCAQFMPETSTDRGMSTGTSGTTYSPGSSSSYQSWSAMPTGQ